MFSGPQFGPSKGLASVGLLLLVVVRGTLGDGLHKQLDNSNDDVENQDKA